MKANILHLLLKMAWLSGHKALSIESANDDCEKILNYFRKKSQKADINFDKANKSKGSNSASKQQGE